jgi:acetate kinase
MNILVLNCGSSSLKFQIIETDLDIIEKNADVQKAKGLVERIGGQSLINFQATGRPPLKQAVALRDHRAALDYVVRWIISAESQVPGIRSLADIHAVGHRVVHGAERFTKSVVIDDGVIRGIEDCIDLAPLHNPANLKGIYAARDLLGSGVPQVAVFDTGFHSTMPETAYLYAIPYQLYRRHKIRRYGFHGTSHRYVAYRYRQLTGKDLENTNIITLHLGNGCSACAIKNGSSVNTSMGLTPLEGLVMGTRGGDIDPSVIEFLSHKEAMSLNEIDALLNKQSGLLGFQG